MNAHQAALSFVYLVSSTLCLPIDNALYAQRARDRGGRDLGHASDEVDRSPPGSRPPTTLAGPSLDGSGNNLQDPALGAADTQLLRLVPSDYADGVSTPAGADRPSARTVSNVVCDQDQARLNRLGASDFLWQWGQFLDHDIDLTDGVDPPELADIEVPQGDSEFDPDGTGTASIPFTRSHYDATTGTSQDNPREQINSISTWIDASNVYGSSLERALALRTLDGTGKLMTSDGNLLPFNTGGLPNAGGDSAELFLAGDVRANEQIGLTALHTLFVREHNRLVERLAVEHPAWTGDELYRHGRRLIAAMMQAITYREYLPALLGRESLTPHDGYDATVDARIANIFSTACYRYGHSALSPELQRLDALGEAIAEGPIALHDAFFSPQRLASEGGLEPLLRGLATQACQAVDPFIIDDVRNFLFGPPGSGGFDLASLNVQRGRDHGLPSYNATRRALGLTPAVSIADISSDLEIRARLERAYSDVESIDLWVGALAEDPLPGSHVGELNHWVIRRQFEALRDGDRFWYQRILSGEEQRFIESSRLSDIIRRNTTIGAELQANVFRIPSRSTLPGDGNGDGVFDISDPVAVLRFLFLGGDAMESPSAADLRADGRLDVSDAVEMLRRLFGPARS